MSHVSLPSYAHLTLSPSQVGLTAASTGRPIEPWEQPVDLPAVDVPSPEPLVQLSSVRGVKDLAAYANADWSGAPSVSWVRKEVATRLQHVTWMLPDNFGLAVFDAWRPLEVQQALYDAVYSNSNTPEGYVSPPSDDPATPPPHVTGGAVDVTLTYKGQPLALGTAFDEFTPQAHTRFFEDTPSVVRGLRRRLHTHMVAAGFVPLGCEWWHFEYGTRMWAAITDRAPLYGPTAPVFVQ